MRLQNWLMLPIVSVSVLACGGSQQAEPAAAAPVAPEPSVATTPTPAPAPEPASAPPPSAEEVKKAEEQKKLAQDFAELEQAHQAELARLTPELRAAAKALADKAYPNVRAALKAALAGPQRAAKSPLRDKDRHPLETLEFLGLKPNQTVLESGPGEGWYTELLAPVLAKSGKLYVTSADANGPKDQRPTLYATRTKLFLARLPEAYGKVETVVSDPKQPKLGADASLDLVLLFRGAHGMVNNGQLAAWLAEYHRALKPNGILGIEQHRAPAGSDPLAMSKKGYLPEAWLIEQVQAAGFKLAAKSEINANPKDTKDYPEGVWSLPPSLREGAKDREKYVAIGESDRMTLRFVKAPPAKPAQK